MGAGLATVVLAVGVLPAVAGAASAASYCGITWGSTAKAAPAMTGAPLTGARVGRHDCFDRLVLDLAGAPAPGYSVRYVNPPYRAEGSGAPLLVAGGAVIQISVHAPAYDGDGNSTVPWGGTAIVVRPDQFQAGGFRTFRDLVWGGTYEGYSSFGLGVRARLPFRVFQLAGPGGGTRLVIDVTHQW
ncbi:MAG: AMIN-like domain-containing (lipo)protein [Acidimicrobiales bacterium]